jgi:proteasome lid subunit RPN8/RPN11
MLLSQHIKEHIIKHSKQFPKQEVCGVVINDKPYKCSNIAENKNEAFVINPDEIDGLIESHGKIQMVYHTHWNDSQPGYLSPPDICNAKSNKLAYCLYHSEFDCWDLFDPNNIINPFPCFDNFNIYSPKEIDYYLKWPFVYNRSDCFSLLRAYYKGMLDIALPDIPRGFSLEETISPSWNLLNENFPKAGFRKLEDDELLKNNDVVGMTLNGVQPHHVAIIIDTAKKTGLHNLGGDRVSELFVYGGSYWDRVTKYRCRHQLLE